MLLSALNRVEKVTSRSTLCVIPFSCIACILIEAIAFGMSNRRVNLHGRIAICKFRVSLSFSFMGPTKTWSPDMLYWAVPQDRVHFRGAPDKISPSIIDFRAALEPLIRASPISFLLSSSKDKGKTRQTTGISHPRKMISSCSRWMDLPGNFTSNLRLDTANLEIRCRVRVISSFFSFFLHKWVFRYL